MKGLPHRTCKSSQCQARATHRVALDLFTRKGQQAKPWHVCSRHAQGIAKVGAPFTTIVPMIAFPLPARPIAPACRV